MDQVLAQARVKVSATSPTWEPQRAYERRLANIMSKTKGPILVTFTPLYTDAVLRRRIQISWQGRQQAKRICYE